MARLRIGIMDVTALVVVGVVIFLPARQMDVAAAYDPALAADIELAQARLAAEPGDGAAAEELANQLVRAGQTDWALRVSGDASRYQESPSQWRAVLAVSSVHAERVEIPEALDWAKKALLVCDRDSRACPQHERVRMQMYVRELEAGIQAIRRGIDPAADPIGFRRAIDRAYPRARLKGGTPKQ